MRSQRRAIGGQTVGENLRGHPGLPLHQISAPLHELVERDWQRLHLELLGADHPGIVAEISATLAASQVSIEELSTDVRDAPMAGGTLFEAQAVLNAPLSVSTDALKTMLEGLANELMVEIRLSEE